jgi:glutamine cyclotransferase
MTDVKKQLDAIDDLRSADEWDDIRRRAPRPDVELDPSPKAMATSSVRRLGVIALALMIAAAGTVFAVRAFRPAVMPQGSPSVEAPTVNEISLEPGIGHMTFAFGSIWVVDANGVTRIDPATGHIQARIAVDGITAKGDGGAPDWSGITSGAGLVWVTAEPQIVGIDPSINEIGERIAVESGVATITFSDGLVAAGGSAEGNGDLRLLDPSTRDFAPGGGSRGVALAAYPSVIATANWYWAAGKSYERDGPVLTRLSKDGSDLRAIAGVPTFDSFTEAGGSLWVTGGDTLYRIDESLEESPASPQGDYPEPVDAVTATFPIEGPAEVASDGSTLWLLERPADGTAQVTQLDPATGVELGDPVAIDRSGQAELAVANGSPWVSFRDDGTLVTLAPISGTSSAPAVVPQVTAQIPMPDDTISYGIAIGAGAVWAGAAPSHGSQGGSLVRIDPATNAITGTIDLQAAPFREEIAPTDDAVWIATSGQILRVDPDTMEVVATIDVPGASAIAADATAVWVAAPDDHSLVRIDPTTNAIAATVPVGGAITGYADQIRIGDGAVWVIGSRLVNENREDGGDLVRVDPNTNAVVDSIPLSGFQIVIGPDGVWVRSPADGVFDRSGERWVWRIVDPVTDQPSEPFTFQDDGLRVVTADSLWSVGYDQNENVVVTRFDPDSLRPVVRSAPIRSYFTDSAVDVERGTAWIAANDRIVRVDVADPTGS